MIQSLPISVAGGKHLIVPALGKHRAHVVGWLIRCENAATRFRFYSANDNDAAPCTGELQLGLNELDDRLMSGGVDAPPAPIVSGKPDEGLQIKVYAGAAALNGVLQVCYEPLA